jgi:hypothetical protein
LETKVQTEDIVIADAYRGVTTEQIIVGMLTENTGRGICDSGDAYGRHWQTNQGKSFADQPAAPGKWFINTYNGKTSVEPWFSVSLYHWMFQFLEFDAELQTRLDAFCEAEDVWNLEAAEAFADHLHDTGELEDKPLVTNTYNDPERWDLSQVLQFTAIALGEGDSHSCPTHLIVCVHGGCDVRGGYTEPKVFRLTSEFYEAMDGAWFNTIYTKSGDAWYAEDPCWRFIEPSDRNEWGIADPMKLPAYEIADISDDCRGAAETLAALRAQITTENEGLLTSFVPPVDLIKACEVGRESLVQLAHTELASRGEDALFGLDGLLYISQHGEDQPHRLFVGNTYF